MMSSLSLVVVAGMLIAGSWWLGLGLLRGTGELVYASNQDGDLEIYRLDIDHRLTVQLTHNAIEDWQPDWSPDGRHIVFTAIYDLNLDIYVMEANGANIRRLADSPSREFSPAWSPDGQRIAFVTDRFGVTDIVSLNLTDQSLRRLTDRGWLNNSPVWSPGGEQIAFVSDRDTPGDTNIYVMKPDGQDTRLLEATPGDELAPAWSPDGRYVLYTSDFGDLGIFLTDLETGQVKLIFADRAIGYDTPAWSPDGRYITFVHAPNGQPGIYLLDTACFTAPDPCDAFLQKLISTPGKLYLNPRWKPG
jgi:TolB protein